MACLPPIIGSTPNPKMAFYIRNCHLFLNVKLQVTKVGDKTVDCCKDVIVVFKHWHTVITQKGNCEQPRQFTHSRNICTVQGVIKSDSNPRSEQWYSLKDNKVELRQGR